MSVDIYIDCELLVEDLGFGQLTDYFTVKPCTYCIKIFPSGKQKGKTGDCPIAEINLTVCPKSAMTIAIVCTCSGVLGIQELYDPCGRARNRCKAYVRFVNLSPNSPSLDVSVAGGTILFRSVAFTARTRYVPVDPGMYVLQLKPAGSNQTGLAMQPVTLDRAALSTVYAVGFAGGTPPLDIVVSTDGVI